MNHYNKIGLHVINCIVLWLRKFNVTSLLVSWCGLSPCKISCFDLNRICFSRYILWASFQRDRHDLSVLKVWLFIHTESNVFLPFPKPSVITDLIYKFGWMVINLPPTAYILSWMTWRDYVIQWIRFECLWRCYVSTMTDFLDINYRPDFV
jgi:hypothetical protein